MTRVFVAMSGGVDSSVAAALLVEAGHDVTGVTMRLLDGDSESDGCCSLDGVRSAKRACDALGIAHYSLEFADVFRREVIEPYCDEYAEGRTPNPCIACNDRVKFSELLRRVSLQEAEFLATGHYARILTDSDGRPQLHRGVDPGKDQSYFLYRMTLEQMSHTLFPLGDLTKTDVRALARRFSLPTAERPESQETCFVPGDDVRGYLRERRPEAFVSGTIVDEGGAVVGAHDGIPGLTVGQRKGLRLQGPDRTFISHIDARSATVTVAARASARVRTVVCDQLVWHGPERSRVTARTRYRGTASRGMASFEGPDLTFTADDDMERPAPGQSLVCYDGDRVLGGGIIREAS